MLIKTKLKVDLSNRGQTPQIHAVQADANSRAVEISLFNHGQPWNVPKGADIAVGYRKPDGTKGIYDTLPDGAPAAEFSGNVITVTLAPQIFTAAGKVSVSAALSVDSTAIGIFPFTVNVESNPGAGAVPSENYVKYATLEALNAALGDLDELITEDRSSIVSAINEIAESAENNPVQISEDGYTDIGGLRQATDIRFALEGKTLTVTTTLEGGIPVTDTITLDDSNYPVYGVFNGVECSIRWEGF